MTTHAWSTPYEERDAPLAFALTRTLILDGRQATEATGWATRQAEQDMRDTDDAQGAR